MSSDGELTALAREDLERRLKVSFVVSESELFVFFFYGSRQIQQFQDGWGFSFFIWCTKLAITNWAGFNSYLKVPIPPCYPVSKEKEENKFWYAFFKIVTLMKIFIVGHS